LIAYLPLYFRRSRPRLPPRVIPAPCRITAYPRSKLFICPSIATRAAYDLPLVIPAFAEITLKLSRAEGRNALVFSGFLNKHGIGEQHAVARGQVANAPLVYPSLRKDNLDLRVIFEIDYQN
jgi:hypothetical protein